MCNLLGCSCVSVQPLLLFLLVLLVVVSLCQVANRLYRSCGFQEHSSEAKYANVSSLGELRALWFSARSPVQMDAVLKLCCAVLRRSAGAADGH